MQVLVVDYASSPARVDNSYTPERGARLHLLRRESPRSRHDPTRPVVPAGVNADDIDSLGQAHNFLYLLDPGGFDSRADYLDTLAATNYDALVIDAFYDDAALTAAGSGCAADEGERWPSAGDRLHEHRRSGGLPVLLATGLASRFAILAGCRNPDWAGNYKVRYWEQGWRDLILSGPESYLNRITAAGFDGVSGISSMPSSTSNS